MPSEVQVFESRVDALARAIARRGSRQHGFGQVAAFVAGGIVGAATSAFADVGATGVAEAWSCPEGTTQCVVCVTTQSDPNNCGACGNVCPTPLNSVATCDTGTCGYICESGFQDCNSDPLGCETNVSSDVNNCGACNHVCAGVHATAVCAAGICGYICESGFQDCNSDPLGCETNIQTDVNNCGACNHVCQGAHTTMACAAGTCVHGPCDAGWLDCDGNAATGCETNIETDVNHCGACDNVCAGWHATWACAGGNCVITRCDHGWLNCDGILSTGCETNIQTDVNNCGACNHVCPQGRACVAGVCT